MNLSIVDALSDPQILGSLPAFRDLTTWRPWLAFLRAVYGLAMSAVDLELFRAHTGRQAPRSGGYPEAVAIVGRQAGKTQVAGVVGALEAALGTKRGEHVVLVAQDLRGAQRALLGYCRKALAGSPILAREVVRDTADTLELANGVSVSVYPCRPPATPRQGSLLDVLFWPWIAYPWHADDTRRSGQPAKWYPLTSGPPAEASPKWGMDSETLLV